MNQPTEKMAPGSSLEEEIIRAAAENIERLPMLQLIFDRHGQGLSAALKSFCGIATESELRGVTYGPMSQVMHGLEESWLTLICEADPWGGQFAVVIDPNLLFAALEILLGGREAEPLAWTPRSFTSIEKNLARQIGALVLDELATAFAPVETVAFALSYLEASPQAAMLAPPKSPGVAARFEIAFEGRGGGLAVVMPHSTLRPVRHKLAELFAGEAIDADSGWHDRLESALTETGVTLTAVLRRLRVPLAEALDWRKGQVLDLGIGPDDEVEVTAGGRTLLRGAMGRRRGGAAALRVTETYFDKNGKLT
ncbi:flagellar motor switch protein FliM [Roseivivax sp. CAU 1761]